MRLLKVELCCKYKSEFAINSIIINFRMPYTKKLVLIPSIPVKKRLL